MSTLPRVRRWIHLLPRSKQQCLAMLQGALKISLEWVSLFFYFCLDSTVFLLLAIFLLGSNSVQTPVVTRSKIDNLYLNGPNDEEYNDEYEELFGSHESMGNNVSGFLPMTLISEWEIWYCNTSPFCSNLAVIWSRRRSF